MLNFARVARKIKGYVPPTFNSFEVEIMAAWQRPRDLITAELHMVRWINEIAEGKLHPDNLLELHVAAGKLLQDNDERRTSPIAVVSELRELFTKFRLVA